MPKPPELYISNIKADGFYSIGCSISKPKISFKVTPTQQLSDIKTPVGFGIWLINQTENTCGENITFFQTRQSCIINVPERGSPYYSLCSPYLPPIKGNIQPLEIEMGDLDEDVEYFLNQTKERNITECKIKEKIRICAIYEGSWKSCSENEREIEVYYKC